MKENVGELLDRYVMEVGKHLPRKNRLDIQREIRSSLADMLEDRSRKIGRPVDDDMIVDVLKEYGAPDAVAATYLPERYLIGPRLYPFFLMVLRIVLAVITVTSLIGLAFALGEPRSGMRELAEIVGRSILEYFQGMITALGYMAFIFAILERFLPPQQIEELQDQKEPWDPTTLLREPHPDAAKTWEPVLSIVFLSAMLALVNFFPQVIGLAFGRTGEAPVVALTDAFYRFLPWLNVVWGLEIIVNLLVLRRGRWTPPTRWASIALSLVGVGIAAAMLAGPDLVRLTAESLGSGPLDPATAETLQTLLNYAVRFGLVVTIIDAVVEIVKVLRRLLARPAPFLSR